MTETPAPAPIAAPSPTPSTPSPASAPAAPAAKAAPTSAAQYAELHPTERFAIQQSKNMADDYYPADATGRLAAKPNPNAPPTAPGSTPAPDPNAPKIKVGEIEMTAEEWKAAAIEKTAREVVRNSLPTPDAYKAELPTDFKPPEGITFQFDATDPLMAQAKTWAFEQGISQDAFKTLLGLYAGAQVSSEAQIQAGRNAELAKLGPAATARLTSVITFLKGQYGAEQGARMASRIFTAQDVQDWERVITNRTSQGAAPFSQQHRDVQQRGRVDQATYDKMSYTEKKNYAARFSQG